MTYGLEIRNGNNQTIIDDTNKLMQVVSRGFIYPHKNFTHTGNNNFWGYDRDSIVYAGDLYNTVTYFRLLPGDSLSFLGRFYEYGPLRTVNRSNPAYAGSSPPLEYITCYKMSDAVGTSGHGLKVFDGAGQTVYNAEYEIMPSNGQFVTYAAGSTNLQFADFDSSVGVWVTGEHANGSRYMSGTTAYGVKPAVEFLTTAGTSLQLINSSYDLQYNFPSGFDSEPFPPARFHIVQMQ